MQPEHKSSKLIIVYKIRKLSAISGKIRMKYVSNVHQCASVRLFVLIRQFCAHADSSKDADLQ